MNVFFKDRSLKFEVIKLRLLAKIFQGCASFLTLEIKKKLYGYSLYFLKLQHENDKMQAKSTPPHG